MSVGRIPITQRRHPNRHHAQTIKPDVMKALAWVLDQNLQKMVSRWTIDAFGLPENDIVKLHDKTGVVLEISNEWKKGRKSERYQDHDIHNAARNIPTDISLITLDEFRNIQGNLPFGSRVYVAATDFLDDDVFFEMVVQNFRKGVRYFYFLEDRLLYTRFLDAVRTNGWDEDADGQLDGHLAFLLSSGEAISNSIEVHRNDSFPLNCVLIEDPERGPQAYLGMIVDNRPSYYQVADIGLTYRVKAAFEGLTRIELG